MTYVLLAAVMVLIGYLLGFTAPFFYGLLMQQTEKRLLAADIKEAAARTDVANVTVVNGPPAP